MKIWRYLPVVMALWQGVVSAQTNKTFTSFVTGTPVATIPLSSSDMIPVVQGGLSKHVAATSIGGGGGGGGTGSAPQAAFFSSTNTVTGNTNVSYQTAYTLLDYHSTGVSFAPVGGTVLQMIGADSTNARVELNAFGTAKYDIVCFGGINGSKAPVGNGVLCGGYDAFAYNGSSAIGPLAAVSFTTAEAQSSGHGGMNTTISATPVGATVPAVHLTVSGVLANIDYNTTVFSSLPVAPAGTALQVAGADSTNSRIELDAFNGTAKYDVVCYGGTAASPTAVGSGVLCGGYDAFAYNGSTAVGPLAALSFTTTQPQSPGNAGMKTTISSTPNGSTTPVIRLTADQDGGVFLGSTTSMGPGTLNAQGLFVNGVAVGGGLTVPNANILSGNGSTLGSITVGSGLSLTGTFPTQTLTATGGAGTPGGANTQVQYNNSGAFGGSSGLTLSATAVTSMQVGLGSDGTGDIWYRNAGGQFTRLAAGTAGQILQMASGLPSWQTIATGGGTVNPGTGPQIAQYPAGSSSSVAGVTLSGDATIAAGGALTIANAAITNAKQANMAANTVKANVTGSSAAPADFAMPACTDTGGNHLNYVAGTGITCGTSSSGGGGTTITLAPGFTNTVGTLNTGSQTITNGSTINGQLWPVAKTSPYGVVPADTGNLLIANNTGITFTLPNPAVATKGSVYQFASDGAN